MCVLLCANPKVREWTDMPQALAYRQALQLCGLCPKVEASEAKLQKCQSTFVASFELDEAAQRRVMKRSAWLQAYCRYSIHVAQNCKHSARSGAPSFSSNEWHKAFETIAKTWGRILSLVGLRW
jgi:hypothetical protein